MYDPSGGLRYEWKSNEVEFDSGLIDDITDELGDWKVLAGTAGQFATGRYSTGGYTVIPEVGTLMVKVTSFGALAGLGTTKRLRLKR